MLRNEAIQPQLNAQDFGFIVNFLKPFLKEFSAIDKQTISTNEKASLKSNIFEKLLNELQNPHQDDLLITFLSENWQKFINDLEANAIFEKLEFDEKGQSSAQAGSPNQIVQLFLEQLMTLLGVEEKIDLPQSGTELVQKLYDRNKELHEEQDRERLKIKWNELFTSKNLSTTHFDDLVNMIENLNLILNQGDKSFNQAAQEFFGNKININHLNSSDIIVHLKAQAHIKPISTPKHQLVLREILNWNQLFTQLQRGKIPEHLKLAKMINDWPQLIDNMFNMSMESHSTMPKTSSRFFKSIKKIFGVTEVPLTQDELVHMLHQRIMLIEPEKLRKELERTLKNAQIAGKE